jgi:hypothetical protein
MLGFMGDKKYKYCCDWLDWQLGEESRKTIGRR